MNDIFHQGWGETLAKCVQKKYNSLSATSPALSANAATDSRGRALPSASRTPVDESVMELTCRFLAFKDAPAWRDLILDGPATFRVVCRDFLHNAFMTAKSYEQASRRGYKSERNQGKALFGRLFVSKPACHLQCARITLDMPKTDAQGPSRGYLLLFVFVLGPVINEILGRRRQLRHIIRALPTC